MVAHAPVVTAPAALSIARLWDTGAMEVSLLHSGLTSTWHVRTSAESYALRLTCEGHRTLAEIKGELAFIDYLAAGGVHVARGRRTSDGDQVLGVTPPGGPPMHATLFEWLLGRHFEYFSPDIGPRLFRLWGATMAKMHRLAREFVLPPDASRPDWFDDDLASCSDVGIAVSPRILAQRDELVAWLRASAIEPAHYGTVHGDLERTNFVLDGNGIGVIDFDDCCRHWFAWDIACALWAFRNAPPRDRSRFLGWFMEGYALNHEPDAERMVRFSELMRLRTIALFLARLRDRPQAVSPADRDWLARTEQWVLSDWRWT